MSLQKNSTYLFLSILRSSFMDSSSSLCGGSININTHFWTENHLILFKENTILNSSSIFGDGGGVCKKANSKKKNL